MLLRTTLVALLLAAGCQGAIVTSVPDGGPPGAVDAGASVLQHHGNASRDGLYLEPALTHAAAAGLHRDPAFTATVGGHVYAQPLYLDRGGQGDALIVATESNEVSALDAATGVRLWSISLGTPVPLSALACGNIDPLGVTGTPVIDAASRTLYLAAMVSAASGAPRQLVFAVALDDHTVRPGWPIDVGALVTAFDPRIQNQRGALILLDGTLYVPYGGHAGDCSDYRGWVVAIPTASPSAAVGWATRVRGGGVWAPGGLSSDGASVFAATGNTFGASTWSDGEAVLRFASGLPVQPSDSFAPANWKQLDDGDVDIGGSGVLLVNLSAATPQKLAVALGKDGRAYLLDREHLGGIGGQLSTTLVSIENIINAAAAVPVNGGVIVAFHGQPATGAGCSGDLSAVRLTAGSPPGVAFAWCGHQNGHGSPIATTTDGSAEPLIWAVGAEGDGRLRAFDAATGAVVFAGGGAAEHLTGVRRFTSPIVARGRIFVAADDQVAAFTTR